jgi:5'-3' exonuclease
VTLNGIREVIDLELEDLKDLAVVCGCDFHREGVKGIGPRKGTLLLRRHGGLEGLLKARGYTHSQREPFLQAREVFDEGNYISIKHLDLSLKSPIIPRLHRILKPVMGEERAAESTETLVGLMKQFYIVQDTLEAWV